MTEPRRFPFGGVPVYNPQSLSKTEALAQFHVRQAAYQSLMDLLREPRPSHVLLIGTRGMGKTTLLQRVRYGVEDDPALNGRYLVLAFPEEQYKSIFAVEIRKGLNCKIIQLDKGNMTIFSEFELMSPVTDNAAK